MRQSNNHPTTQRNNNIPEKEYSNFRDNRFLLQGNTYKNRILQTIQEDLERDYIHNEQLKYHSRGVNVNSFFRGNNAGDNMNQQINRIRENDNLQKKFVLEKISIAYPEIYQQCTKYGYYITLNEDVLHYAQVNKVIRHNYGGVIYFIFLKPDLEGKINYLGLNLLVQLRIWGVLEKFPYLEVDEINSILKLKNGAEIRVYPFSNKLRGSIKTTQGINDELKERIPWLGDFQTYNDGKNQHDTLAGIRRAMEQLMMQDNIKTRSDRRHIGVGHNLLRFVGVGGIYYNHSQGGEDDERIEKYRSAWISTDFRRDENWSEEEIRNNDLITSTDVLYYLNITNTIRVNYVLTATFGVYSEKEISAKYEFGNIKLSKDKVYMKLNGNGRKYEHNHAKIGNTKFTVELIDSLNGKAEIPTNDDHFITIKRVIKITKYYYYVWIVDYYRSNEDNKGNVSLEQNIDNSNIIYKEIEEEKVEDIRDNLDTTFEIKQITDEQLLDRLLRWAENKPIKETAKIGYLLDNKFNGEKVLIKDKIYFVDGNFNNDKLEYNQLLVKADFSITYKQLMGILNIFKKEKITKEQMIAVKNIITQKIADENWGSQYTPQRIVVMTVFCCRMAALINKSIVKEYEENKQLYEGDNKESGIIAKIENKVEDITKNIDKTIKIVESEKVSNILDIVESYVKDEIIDEHKLYYYYNYSIYCLLLCFNMIYLNLYQFALYLLLLFSIIKRSDYISFVLYKDIKIENLEMKTYVNNPVGKIRDKCRKVINRYKNRGDKDNLKTFIDSFISTYKLTKEYIQDNYYYDKYSSRFIDIYNEKQQEDNVRIICNNKKYKISNLSNIILLIYIVLLISLNFIYLIYTEQYDQLIHIKVSQTRVWRWIECNLYNVKDQCSYDVYQNVDRNLCINIVYNIYLLLFLFILNISVKTLIINKVKINRYKYIINQVINYISYLIIYKYVFDPMLLKEYVDQFSYYQNISDFLKNLFAVENTTSRDIALWAPTNNRRISDRFVKLTFMYNVVRQLFSENSKLHIIIVSIIKLLTYINANIIYLYKTYKYIFNSIHIISLIIIYLFNKRILPLYLYYLLNIYKKTINCIDVFYSGCTANDFVDMYSHLALLYKYRNELYNNIKNIPIFEGITERIWNKFKIEKIPKVLPDQHDHDPSIERMNLKGFKTNGYILTNFSPYKLTACVHNQTESVYRQINSKIDYDEVRMDDFLKFSKRKLDELLNEYEMSDLRQTPLNVEKYIDSMGHKKPEYVEGWDTYNVKQKVNLSYAMHNKTDEKIFINYATGKMKARNISAQHSTAKVINGVITDRCMEIIHNKEWCGPGSNNEEKCRLYKKWMDQIGNWKIVCGDGSAFDSTQHQILIKHIDAYFMWRVYLMHCTEIPIGYIDMKKVLLQDEFRVFSKFYTYFIKGTQMTGRMNTCLGNTMRSWLYLYYITTKMGKEDEIHFQVNGDDQIAFMDENYVEDFKGCAYKLVYAKEDKYGKSNLGQIAKIFDVYSYNEPGAEFLSNYLLVDINNNCKLIRKIDRFCQLTPYTISNQFLNKDAYDYLNGRLCLAEADNILSNNPEKFFKIYAEKLRELGFKLIKQKQGKLNVRLRNKIAKTIGLLRVENIKIKGRVDTRRDNMDYEFERLLNKLYGIQPYELNDFINKIKSIQEPYEEIQDQFIDKLQKVTTQQFNAMYNKIHKRDFHLDIQEGEHDYIINVMN